LADIRRVYRTQEGRASHAFESGDEIGTDGGDAEEGLLFAEDKLPASRP
jgi:hypothetical protein